MVLNLIVNRDKIKETYLSASDTDFKILFSSSDWHRMYKKAIFLVEENSYIVEGLEDNHIYQLPEACVGTEFSVYIIGEMANEFKSTERLLVRMMGGGGSGGGSEEYALKSIYADNAVSMGRKEGTIVGNNSFAFGYNATASRNYSYAFGYNATASENYSYAFGYNATASGFSSHAEGRDTTASGYYSHAEGVNTTASEYSSHAEGEYTIANTNSHAEGYGTTALKFQHVQGCKNDETIATENDSMGTGTGTAFVIGNGTYISKSNAFRVDYNGKVFAKSEYASTGADYAEYFEWLDGNEDDEDRRGFFVTMEGDKIKKANTGDYILGIVSGQPAVLGNNDEEYMGRYELDEFNCFVEEEITVEIEKINEETGETETEEITAKHFKEKDTYDPTLPYIPRAKRKEWSAIGMLGVLSVRDDDTCEVGGYCKCSENGIATKAEEGYRVIKRVNNNIVKVILK